MTYIKCERLKVWLNLFITFPLCIPFYFLFLTCLRSRTASSVRKAVSMMILYSYKPKMCKSLQEYGSRFSAPRSFKSGRVFINTFFFLYHVIVSSFMLTQCIWYDKYVLYFHLLKYSETDIYFTVCWLYLHSFQN